MESESRGRRRSESASADSANLGLVRPPLVYLCSIALGLAIHYAWPVRVVPPSVSTPAGAVLVLLSVGLCWFTKCWTRARRPWTLSLSQTG